MKNTLAKITHFAENVWDGSRVQKKYGPDEIEIMAYMGYGSTDVLRFRGRVLQRQDSPRLQKLKGRVKSLSDMLSLFMTEEIADVTVTIPALRISSTTDEEGYYDITIPRPDNVKDSYEICLPEYGVSATASVSVLSPDSDLGIISDIDDTLMRTEAWSLRKNIVNSMTGNSNTRHVYPDAVNFMNRLNASDRPVFYVSSSPWNFYNFLASVFDRSALPRGPMFLRDYGIDIDKFITKTHGDHKLNAIREIMQHHPKLKFLMIGDMGQDDPRIYNKIVHEFPGRVRGVVFRRTPNADERDKLDSVRRLRSTGTPVSVVTTYNTVTMVP